MRKRLKDNKKQLVLDELAKSRGLIATACRNAGIDRKTYYNWYKEDPEFAQKCDDVQELEGDRVESNYKQLIDEGDTAATLFYMKTKLKHRGYTERDIPVKSDKAQAAENATAKALAMVQNKVEEITEMLKQQGKYSIEYNMQINLVAQLAVKADMAFTQTMLPDYNPISVQISREGNERQTISAAEVLYRQYSEQYMSALRALGLNADSKQRIDVEGDGLSAFLNKFSSEEDD